MAIVLDLISDSLQDAGIISSIEAPSDVDAQKCFRILNRMLDSWSIEKLMLYQDFQEVFAFVANQATYTMGVGGDFNSARPINVTKVLVRDVNNNDIPVEIVNYDKYSDIISKGVTSTIPLCVYYDVGFPLSNFTFWPVVSATSYRPVIWSQKLLTGYTTINDSVILPPGYEEAIVQNLAVKICTAYQSPIPAGLEDAAKASISRIKRMNFTPLEMQVFTTSVNNSTFPIAPFI
jgi:hypothetical protein